MNVSLALVEGDKQIWQKLDVPEGCTIKQVIKISGIEDEVPGLNLDEREVGIHGKLADMGDILREGDRIEIYRPITADPSKVKRRSIPTSQAK